MRTHNVDVTDAELDVIKERTRQVVDEQWTAEHDDAYPAGTLALAGATYALPKEDANGKHGSGVPVWRALWPFDGEWFKPKDRRRDLVRSAALIIAEIEKIDRADVNQT